MDLEKWTQRKVILLDASSAILLAKAGFHELMTKCYSILMSASVFDEVTRKNLPGSAEYKKMMQERRLVILPVLGRSLWNVADVSLQKLDRGERDTFFLFYEGRGDFVVTDDGAAAKFCLSENIPFVNSLLMLRILHHSGMIGSSSYEAGVRNILTLGRYSDKVRDYVRDCADSELLFFLP